MTQSTEDSFIQDVIETLEQNGYPDKKVSLPLEKMYETTDKLGLNFNTVLTKLKKQGINSLSTVDKIIFSSTKPNAFENLDHDEMIKKAQEFVKNLSSKQVDEIKDSYQKMSPEQREEILKRGKEMGLL